MGDTSVQVEDDWNDERCLSYDWCKKNSDEEHLDCHVCDHKQYEIDPDYLREMKE